MTKDVAGWDLADAISDPRSVFSHPNEVVLMEQLFRRDKLAILNSWKQLEEESARSGDLAEADGEPNLLIAVELAIEEVG